MADIPESFTFSVLILLIIGLVLFITPYFVYLAYPVEAKLFKK